MQADVGFRLCLTLLQCFVLIQIIMKAHQIITAGELLCCQKVPIKQLEWSHHYNHFEMQSVVKPASSALLKSLSFISGSKRRSQSKQRQGERSENEPPSITADMKFSPIFTTTKLNILTKLKHLERWLVPPTMQACRHTCVYLVSMYVLR